MGFGKEGRNRSWFVSHRVWMVCLVLGFLVAVLHLTVNQTFSLTKSFKGWLLHADSANLPQVGNEELPKLPPAEKQPASTDIVGNKLPKHPRVAICLVGGARAFELTGLSIKKHVLDAYNMSDVFLHVPFDSNAHKLTLLAGASKLAMARIFHNSHVPESLEAREVLTAANSPNGIQGLLQYFRLVEGCLHMISSYETKHMFKYDWIVRTRVDGYWSGPLPPLGQLNPKFYHVPYGSRYGGLNDRLGIGTRNTSWPALSRLSLIKRLHWRGYREQNSEAAFRHQLVVSHVRVKADDFRFCILTARKYAWPMGKWGVPVASIKSKGALNGAKCKPCHPVVSGHAAAEAVTELDRNWGWIRPVKDLRLCDSRHDAEPGWQAMFDEASGPQWAHVRKRIMNRTQEECIQEVNQFEQLWESWDAPAAENFCRRHVVHEAIVSNSSPTVSGRFQTPSALSNSSQPSPAVSNSPQSSRAVSNSPQPSPTVSNSPQPSPAVSNSSPTVRDIPEPSPPVSNSFQPSPSVSNTPQPSPLVGNSSQPEE